jgi:hypothetical protein
VSDEFFSLAMALTCIALILVLYHRWRAGRALRKLIQSLDESKKEKQ